MRLGTCASSTHAAAAQAAGFDFIEENAQRALAGLSSDDDWDGERELATSPLAIPSVNSFVPAALKIVGPSVDEVALDAYAATVIRRAEMVGVRTIVFGAGAARNVPDGFPHDDATKQLVRFLHAAAPHATKHGVTIAIEHLNRAECNIVTTLAQAVRLAETVDRPAVKCLLDTYHFWLEDESLASLEAALPWIVHVHLADRDGRLLPGNSGTADYLPVFRLLKKSGYDGLFAFEGRPADDFGTEARKAVEYTRHAWDQA